MDAAKHIEVRAARSAALPRDPAALLAEVRRRTGRRAAGLVATLLVLQGEGELRDPLSSVAHPAEQGMRLARECTLKVRTGCALVRLDDGSDLWLAAGTELDFSSWGATKRAVRLALGRMLALVARDKTRPFSVFTPAASVLVTGTAFQAIATPERLDVAVLHGAVECRAGAATARARRGWRVSLPRQGPPDVRRFDPADLALDPPALFAASASNPKLRPACRAVGNTLYPDCAPSKGSPLMAGIANLRKHPWLLLLLALTIAGLWWWHAHGSSVVAAGQLAYANHAAAQRATPDPNPVATRSAAPIFGDPIYVRGPDGSPLFKGYTKPGEKLPPDALDLSEVGRLNHETAAKGGASKLPVGPLAHLPSGASADQQFFIETSQAANRAVMDLIRAGVPRDQAMDQVMKGMQESLNQRAAAEGKLPGKIVYHSSGNTFGYEVIPPPPGGRR